MTCTCIDKVNRQLRASSGHHLVTMPARSRTGGRERRVLVRATADNPMRRDQPIVIATHCPYCGRKYED